jgi:hypothetical protein
VAEGGASVPGKGSRFPEDGSSHVATCHDATGYTDRIPGTLAPGLKLCVYTAEKRYAMLVLRSSIPSHGDNGIMDRGSAGTWAPLTPEPASPLSL